MDYYSIWPAFACMAALLGLASTPIFRVADAHSSSSRNRVVALDGLRGFLALAVFFHHGAFYHRFLIDGEWTWPPSRFYSLLGPLGVAMFFMITGFLFWGRLVDEGGRPKWLNLYIGRLFRIGPLYLFTAILVLSLVFIETGPNLQVSSAQLAGQIVRWFALGVVLGPAVNGYENTWQITAGVTWTLRLEWAFYALLPVLGLLTRRSRHHLPAAVIIFLTALVWLMVGQGGGLLLRPIWWSFFSVGILCASLQKEGIRLMSPGKTMSCLGLAFIIAVFCFPSVEAVGPVLLLGAAFFLITSGCSFFGLLTSQPARRLGDISYGIYLLHGTVLFVVLRSDAIRSIAIRSPLDHWAILLACAVLVICSATATYALLERPGVVLGRRVAAKLLT